MSGCDVGARHLRPAHGARADRPAEETTPATPEKTDLEKYLLLAQEPMNTDVLKWWKLRDNNKKADLNDGPQQGSSVNVSTLLVHPVLTPLQITVSTRKHLSKSLLGHLY